MNTWLSAKCIKCDKPVDTFDRTLVKEGVQRKVRCHGETIVHVATHREMRHRFKSWFMISKFPEWIQFREMEYSYA